MRKNLIFTFCFACIPGAGQMYLGYQKRGLSLMTLFFGVIGLAVLFRLDAFLMVLPIIFAYAFFDTFHIRNTPPEQLLPDDFAGYVKWLAGQNYAQILQTRHKLLGWGCIGMGILLVYRMVYSGVLYDVLEYLGMDWLRGLMYQLPSLCLAVALVLLGVYLLRGKKTTQGEDFVAFKGE